MDFIYCQPPSAQVGFGSKITTDALYRRMTPMERRRLELASIDPGVNGAARDMAADLRMGSKRLSGAAYFDLALPENIVAITAMSPLLDPPQHGGATRVSELLKFPVTDPDELPGSVRVHYGLPEVPV